MNVIDKIKAEIAVTKANPHHWEYGEDKAYISGLHYALSLLEEREV